MGVNGVIVGRYLEKTGARARSLRKEGLCRGGRACASVVCKQFRCLEHLFWRPRPDLSEASATPLSPPRARTWFWSRVWAVLLRSFFRAFLMAPSIGASQHCPPLGVCHEFLLRGLLEGPFGSPFWRFTAPYHGVSLTALTAPSGPAPSGP
eukprot:10205675-Lingulodinium_polyedra.AAC.1